MEFPDAYIIISILSSLFTLVGLVFWNYNKFKFAEIKHQHSLDYMFKKDQIDAKRFKRKQTAIVVPTAPEKSVTGTLGGIAQLAPLLKNLDSDQISGLIDTFIGGRDKREFYEDEEEEGGAGGGSMNMLLDFAEKNPEVVQGLLQGLTKGAKGGGNQQQAGSGQV